VGRRSHTASHGSVTEDAIANIRRMILDGELRAGDRLPPENDLSAQLSVSRSSLRETVRALALLGVLATRQGDGTYVTSLEPDVLLEATAFVVDLMPETLDHELLQVRRILEPEATAIAASRITDEQLADVRACLLQIESATSTEGRFEADVRFHHLIVEASGNRTLASLNRSMSSRTLRIQRWRAATEPSVFARASAEHQAIYEALVARDGELARAVDLTHIAGGEASLRRKRLLEEHAVDGSVDATAGAATSG
jgi:GntR family transcriptional repressor for pyruvate dehydrogenase complex